MRDHLDSLTQVGTLPLLIDDGLIDLPSGDVVGLSGRDVQKSFIVPEVEISFRTVLRDITFTVLVGIQRAGIDVYIRVELLNRDGEPPSLKEFGKRCRNDALSQGGC